MSNAWQPELTITGLSIYPVKSMQGISLERASLTPLGLKYDRSWMIVDDQCEFVTQRQLATLALIVPTLETEGLVLSAPEGSRITVPFDQPAGEHMTTNVWGQACSVVDEGQVFSRWLDEVLDYKRPLRLVRMAEHTRRQQTLPELLGADTHVQFADAAPFLIVNEASLAAVNTALAEKGEQAVPMDRFRGNIVVKGIPAFEEHKWAGVRGVDFQMQFRMACERCVMTSIDQATADRHPHGEPVQTVRALNPSSDNPKSPVFGHYASLSKGEGVEVSCGDRLTLLD